MSSAGLFQLASWVSAVVLVGALLVDSMRKRRVTPMLAMTVALWSIFWMEAPYDWATWTQFNPALPRIPAWGPLGMTAGGLPWIAPIGYIMYCALPVAIIVWAAPRIANRLGTNRIRTLLTVGVVFSFCWDVCFQIFGTHIGWWRFSRGYNGLTIFAGTPYLFTLTISIFTATLFTVCAYLVGRVDDHGRSPLERWAHARSASRPGLWLIVASVAVTQVIFAVLFVPNLIAKLANVAGTTSSLPLFDGLAPQPGSEPSAYATAGGLTLAAVLIAMLAAAIYTIVRLDPQAHTPAPARRQAVAAGG